MKKWFRPWGRKISGPHTDDKDNTMIRKFTTLLAVSLGGSAGWWLGAKVGFMTGYFLGVFGASAGLYLGRQFGRNYLD
jgi:hypothetical protein